jgi:pilus assembly protein Flp/PilA
MKAIAEKFLKDERGLETVEYAIILGLIVAGTIGLVVAIGNWVHSAFGRVNNDMATNPVP